MLVDGITEVGTVNRNGNNQSFNLAIYDKTGGDTEENVTYYVSDDEEATTGVIFTTISHKMQGVVTPGSTVVHQPWFDAR